MYQINITVPFHVLEGERVWLENAILEALINLTPATVRDTIEARAKAIGFEDGYRKGVEVGYAEAKVFPKAYIKADPLGLRKRGKRRK